MDQGAREANDSQYRREVLGLLQEIVDLLKKQVHSQVGTERPPQSAAARREEGKR